RRGVPAPWRTDRRSRRESSPPYRDRGCGATRPAGRTERTRAEDGAVPEDRMIRSGYRRRGGRRARVLLIDTFVTWSPLFNRSRIRAADDGWIGGSNRRCKCTLCSRREWRRDTTATCRGAFIGDLGGDLSTRSPTSPHASTR